MSTPDVTPFIITRRMFAIKRDGAPHLILMGERGTRTLKSPEALAAWAQIYNAQSDAVRESATVASMFGWHVPAARAAVAWSRGEQS